MTEDFKSLLEAYKELHLQVIAVQMFICNRGLEGELAEFINEQTMSLNLNKENE